MEEKFALDVWYVDNRSLCLDFKILGLTIWKVLKRDGISAEGEATMPEFMGTCNELASDMLIGKTEAAATADQRIRTDS